MTPTHLRNIELTAATSQHGIKRDDALALVAEVRRLTARCEAMRMYLLVDDDPPYCQLCGEEQQEDESWPHADGCLAAPEAQ